MNPALTVVLTLRGRALHTLRWLWHADRVRLPYHVIVADGEVHPAIDRVLSDKASFPNLSFEYHRHDDASFSHFYRKCAETLRRVDTPFAMMSDNDDFSIVAGIDRSVAFLEREPGYVCAGGQLPDFDLRPDPALPGKVVGRMAPPRFGYRHQCRDIAFPTSSERVMDAVRNYQTVYYHVYRTPALRTIFEEAERLDFSDLTAHEHFCALRTATLGKVRTDPASVCYLRQRGTSTVQTYWVDWVHHLLRGKLPQDYRALASSISDEVKKAADGHQVSPDEILDAYADRIRHMLGHTMMRHRFPRLFALKQSLSWLREVQPLPKACRDWCARRRFWRKLCGDCGDPGLRDAYREELAEIEASLSGKSFLPFLKKHAPELQPVPSASGASPS